MFVWCLAADAKILVLFLVEEGTDFCQRKRQNILNFVSFKKALRMILSMWEKTNSHNIKLAESIEGR